MKRRGSARLVLALAVTHTCAHLANNNNEQAQHFNDAQPSATFEKLATFCVCRLFSFVWLFVRAYRAA